ncbi:uncharacterized protein LOC110686079 [Chenopodium quinoa]|uniref:uncharacterized protein LOC110686079 n=1 Tax=Chenopodium quinoa TaxID=63459 RepID=UPI000B771053|nr:uncharacterized protein LOC110686079 [Chenopodium quinoa]
MESEKQPKKQTIVPKSVTMDDLLQLVTQLNTNRSTSETLNQAIQISKKLNHSNYTKWSKLMQLAIGGRGRLNHITVVPPSPTDPEIVKWTQRDSIVISWIIDNIEPELQNQYLDYPTANELWKSIEIMYGSGRDGLQIFDLMTKANKIQQGSNAIEVYYSKLTLIWKEIDRRLPNPMKCSEDKTVYNRMAQQNRLYQFLAGLDEALDKDRRDLINSDPLPTIEVAYATIRREISRKEIMKKEKTPTEDSEIGSGLAARGKPEKPKFRRDDERTHLRCTHYGGTRHTKEGCFKLIGYPEWWSERKKKGENQRSGKATDAGESSAEEKEEGGLAAAIVSTGFSDREDHWAWY